MNRNKFAGWNNVIHNLYDDLSEKEKSTFTYYRLMTPKKGDRFTEMFSFWLFIMDVDDEGYIWTMEAHGGQTVPEDGKIKKYTPQQIIKRFSYNSPNLKEKCWIRYIDNVYGREDWGIDVWLKENRWRVGQEEWDKSESK